MNFTTTEMLIYHDAQTGKVPLGIAKRYINKLMRIISDCSDEYTKVMNEYYNMRREHAKNNEECHT